ncbi:MAG: putative motility protein [Tepidisphaeraceae bacterium]
MDLTAAVVNMKQAQVMGQVQMRVAKKMLDMQEMQGAAAVQRIEAAGRIAASAGDSLVAAATGLGGAIDTYA